MDAHPPSDAVVRAVRGIRVALIAPTTFALAAGAHLAGGGALPTGLGLVALLTLTVAISAVLARGPLRAATLLPAVAALELVLHRGFDVVAAAQAAGPAGTTPGVGAMDHMAAGSVAAALPAVHGSAASMSPAMPGASWMLLAHGLGTLVTVAVLVAGDRAARRTLVWFCSVLPAVQAVADEVPARRRAQVVDGRPGPRPTPAERGGVARRGPPQRYVLAS